MFFCLHSVLCAIKNAAKAACFPPGSISDGGGQNTGEARSLPGACLSYVDFVFVLFFKFEFSTVLYSQTYLLLILQYSYSCIV